MGFVLGAGEWARWHLRTAVENHLRRLSLPFLPLDMSPEGEWRFWCPKLDANGRCGIYDDRPAACRNYEPQTDGLCVHYWGTESGDPTFDGAMTMPLARGAV